MPDGSGTWWAEHAWLGGERNQAGVLLEVDDGRFVSVTTGVVSPPPGSTHLNGLTLPGFASAHSHAFHRVLRGRTQEGLGSFWTWRQVMYEAAGRMHPDLYQRLARAVFAEMAVAGYTAVGEFHYLHHGPGGIPYANVNAMGEALIDAAVEAGIRLTLLDCCYLSGGFGTELDEHQKRFSDGTAEAWMDRVAGLSDSRLTHIGSAIHSIRAVSLEEARDVAAFAGERGMVLHAHVSEQLVERDDCIDTYGMTPLFALDTAGAVSPRFTAVHGTHLTRNEILLLARAGAGVCACPSTERDLGDGIGPFEALRQAGVPIALGSDSNAVIDPFEEARSLEMASRLAGEARSLFAPAELLGAATGDSMAAIGWEPTELKAGAPADFVTIALDSVRTAGCDPELPATAVFAASSADVSQVVVAGNVVVDAGVHVRVDPGKEIAACIGELLG